MYVAMRSIDCSISLSRSRQSLGGTNCLFENPPAEFRADAAAREQIDTTAEEFLEPQLDTSELDQVWRMMKFDQQIDIAAGTGPAARDRAKQSQGLDAQLVQLGLQVRQSLERVAAFHTFVPAGIIALAPTGIQ